MSKRIIKDIPQETLAQTRKASDPQSSIWVSANAGSGKTHVLSERVIRLLLDDVEPSTIICLTYTKAAAAVMANRVFERLAAWTTLDDEALSKSIQAMEDQVPSASKLTKARRLFARALETPGGLKIQTIHAFCQMILARFPLEANIAGRFELIDDDLHKHALAQSRRLVLKKAAERPDSELASALREVVGTVGEHALEKLFDQTLQTRDREALSDFSRGLGEGDESRARLFAFLGVHEGDTEESVLAKSWPLKSVPVRLMQQLQSVAASSTLKTQNDFGERLLAVLSNVDATERFAILKAITQTEGGARRKFTNLLKKELLAGFPNIGEIIEALADEVDAIEDHVTRVRTANLTIHGLILVDAVLREYAAYKMRRTLLDHDDVIERTVKLLTQSGASAWVQYKLDQGINHILVDEAQDTSPLQWQVITTLAEEFFSGETARSQSRTLFAVGDEKQSIYSFQGARPEVFSQTGRQTKSRADAVNRKYDEARLNLSFRSTADVLNAVDLVFDVADNRRGLTFNGDYQPHQPIRVHGPGRVEIWPVVKPLDKEDVPDDWTMGLRHEAAPPVRLANAIAKTIEDWLKNNKQNAATGQPIEARDIMVLVRKRGPFVHALSRELKNRDVAVSGADRLILTNHIAVKDLLAIARFCLFPGDDLSLAALLRSPLFALTDNELLDLAAYRNPGQSLFEKLVETSGEAIKLHRALTELLRWRAEASGSTVFDFYARILSRDHVRARLIQRLGVEAGDIIDEFLNHALASEQAGLAGLQDFVETLESAAPEIKREMDASRNEVRIMTAHAAKGQESPVVFLVDPPPADFSPASLMTISTHPPLFVWEAASGYRTSATAAIQGKLKVREEEEFRRLLYVGMTRAEDQLIICGFGNRKNSEKATTWLKMVTAGLNVEGAPIRSEFQPHLDAQISVYQTTSAAPPAHEGSEDQRKDFLALPQYLHDKMPAARLVPRPLSPSSASHIIEPEEVSGTLSPVLSQEIDGASFAIERGLVLHKLLELLPDIDKSMRESTTEQYLAYKAGSWSDQQRTNVKRQALTVLENPQFAAAFAKGSRAEISIMGRLKFKDGEHVISGKIDRIVVEENRVLLIDYKTNHAVPHDISEIPSLYVTQMALYRALLKPLFDPKPIEAGLLFTSTATLFSLPGTMLDDALEALTDS